MDSVRLASLKQTLVVAGAVRARALESKTTHMNRRQRINADLIVPSVAPDP